MKRSISGYHAGSCDNYRGGGDHEDAEIRRKGPPFGDVIEAGLAKGKLIGKEDF
jgi:hypothetical protein